MEASEVFDTTTGETGTLHDWSLSFEGFANNANDTYVLYRRI